MDPVACIERLLIAIDDSDFDEAKAALDDLNDWRLKGGWVPRIDVIRKHGDVPAQVHRLIFEISWSTR